jgi:D-amino-acid dehydrogenase
MRLIIVGAGIVGAACAYAASGLGAQVTLVDAERPGRATPAGAGIICPWTASVADPARYDFARTAAREYPALIAGLAEAGEPDVSYRRVGALLLAGDDDQLEQARQRITARQAGAPEMGEVHLIDEAQAQRLFPPLRPGAAAVHIAGAARVDGGRVTGVTVDGEPAEADVVVAAAGAWTAPFLAPAGVTVNVVPQRGQIVHIELAGADTSRWPVVLPSATGHYLLAFDGSRVVAGATRETGSGFDVRVTPGGLAEVLTNALSVAPGLSGGTLLETRVGLRPVGPDIRPLLGPVRGVDGLVVATGLGASGLTMGPLAGAVAARVALGLPPGVDLAPFDPLRS